MTMPQGLNYDDKATITIAHNSVQHDRTKHVEIDGHFMKEKLSLGLICTPYVSTRDQMANVLTKDVNKICLRTMLTKLGMLDIFVPA